MTPTAATTGRPDPPELAARLPPHSREAEAGVLGAVLRDADAAHELIERLRPEDFYLDAHRRIFAAAGRLLSAGKPADVVTVYEALTAAGEVADAGGVGYLAELFDAVPTAANAAYHAGIVREAAKLRALIHSATELLRDAWDRVEPADDLAARFGERIADVAADGRGDREPVPLSAAVAAALTRYDDAATGRARDDMVPTGFAALDKLLTGFGPGQLVVAAARPGVGKTALALRVAANVGRLGVPVLIFSLEMSERECTDRLLAAEAGVPLARLRSPAHLSDDQSRAIVAQAERGGLAGLPVRIDDRPGLTAAQVAATTRRYVRRHGVRLVVVDYLQLLRPEDRRAARYLQVGADARRLKDLARESGVTVLCLAQLNREVEARGDGKPRPSDLRDSGEIEQHADVVLLLHRLDDDETARTHRVDLIVAKQRNGPTGTVPLSYERPFTRFEERTP